MAEVKNTRDRCIDARTQRLVERGGILEVPDELVWSYTQQERWAPHDESAKFVTSAVVAQILADENGPEAIEEPAGNASREAWAEYVTTLELATADDVADMTRDEIRDTYKKES